MSVESPIVDRRPPEFFESHGSEEIEAEPDAIEDAPGAWPEDVDVRFYADTSLTIPGMSPPPGECGTWGPREYCKVCGEVVLGPQKCQRRICEDCWLTWRGNRAGAITRRLAGARQAAEGREKRLTHTVVSPPPGEVGTLVDFERAKQRAYDIAKEKGVRGGVLIPHGWRVREEAKQLYRESVDAGILDEEMGIWQWVREERPEDWRTLTYWSPHFHILGLGYSIEESDPEGDDGWVFSRIDSFDAFRITDKGTYKSMLKASAYLLSHVAFEPDEGNQTVRWFGTLANNQFSLESELSDWEQSKIERTVEELTDGDDRGDGERECGEDGCGGQLAPIWSAAAHLADPEWCERIGREQEAVLAAAFEWSIGDIVPPPGLRYPSTERDCKEAWGYVLEQAGAGPGA
jgi:hypothetical protein